MKRLAFIVLLWPAIARAQFAPQQWTADQDGGDFLCYDVHSLQVNNMSGVGSRCVEVDSTGTFFAVPCSSIGGVSSVTGTASRILASPTTGAVVVDLATFATASTCTNSSVVTDAWGRTTCTSGTAPVTSIGVAAPITTTGGTTPTIGISLPSANVAYGTGTNVASSAFMQWNGHSVGVLSQQELQIYNDAVTAAGLTGFRIGIDAAFASSFAFDMIAPGWSSGGGLATGDVLAEENASATSQLLFSNFAGGPVKFASGSSRAPTFTIAPAIATLGDVALFQKGPIQFGDGTTITPVYGVATATQATYYAAFKDSTASKGATFGDGVPGSAPTDDGVFSTWNGATWSERGRWVNGGSLKVGSLGTAMTKAVAGVLTDAASGTDYQAPMSAADGTVVFPTATTIRRSAITGNTTIAAGSNVSVTSALTDAAGAGSSHATTGSWGASKLIQTDAGGAITAGAALCGQLPAFTGDLSSAGGTCSIQAVALEDGFSARWPTAGTWANGSVVTMQAGTLKAVTVAAQATKYAWMIVDSLTAAIAAGEWALTSRSTFPGLTLLIELPNDFKANSITMKGMLQGSTGGVGQTLACGATLNGSGIAGTTISYVMGTYTMQTVGPVSTGSASANDTYGLFCSGTGLAGALITLSEEMVLTP